MSSMILQQIRQFIGFFVAFALALFLPAGTLAWGAAWMFLALFFGFYLALTVWLIRHNPALLQERMRLRAADQQGWDKLLFPVLLSFPFAWLIFMSFDAVHAHWSPVPVWLQIVGAIVLVGSFALLFLVFRENTYLSPVVRIQEERGHTVVSTGPYHYVRHPMYAAIVVFVVGTPLLLGSWSGVLVGLLFVVLLARRAVLEERTLRAELPGYPAYLAQVKYRLIPYVW
jgi:protein-S-isoprenylcysteine O-methyltransferase Ste14